MAQPFSNGAEWDAWSANWCERCRVDLNDECPLITMAVVDGLTPPQWRPYRPNSLGHQYLCTSFVPYGPVR